MGDRLSVNLRTVAGEAPVRIEGNFLTAGPDFTGELLVESEGLIAIDKDLINALDMPTQRIVRPFGIRGWMRLVARMQWRSPGAAPTNYLLMTLHDCAMLYDKFPYPISQIRGTLEMNGRHWSIRDLEGRNDSAYITCAGRWLPTEPEGGQLTLDLVGSDIPLEDELRDAVNPAARQLWASLQPRGTVDHVGVNLTYRTSDGRLGLDVRAQKWPQSQNVEGRTITIQPESFPYRMDHLTGSIHYRDGQINLTDLRAAHGQVALSADGYCRVVEGGSWQLQFERFAAERLTCDQELIAALPSRLGRAVDRLNLEGALNVSGRLQLDGCGGGQNLASNWDMVLDIENGSLGRGTRVEHIHGGLRCVGNTQGEQFNAQGELAIDSLMWQGQQFTQVRGPLLLDGSQLLCGAWARPRQGATDQVRRLTAGLFGGRFEADARLAFDDQGRYDVDARLIDSDLATLAQEAMPRQHKISGKAYGTLQLTGNCLGTYSLKGGGQVQLVDADIYEVPIMVALLKILSVRRPDTTAFTESQIDYRIDGEHIYLDRIDFHGDMITLKGKGSVGLDRYIEGMEFYTLVGPDCAPPPPAQPDPRRSESPTAGDPCGRFAGRSENQQGCLPGTQRDITAALPGNGSPRRGKAVAAATPAGDSAGRGALAAAVSSVSRERRCEMSVGPMGLIGSIAGTPLSQTKGSEVDRTSQDTANQVRSGQALERAENAAGIGQAEARLGSEPARRRRPAVVGGPPTTGPTGSRRVRRLPPGPTPAEQGPYGHDRQHPRPVGINRDPRRPREGRSGTDSRSAGTAPRRCARRS